MRHLRRDLAEYSAELLPPSALRALSNEMSCLSAQGWRWVLPSLLPFCVTQDTSRDPHETEFLIYNLAPSAEHAADAREELSALSDEQIECLIAFLLWCQKDSYWSGYCADEIEQGIGFLRSLSLHGA